MKNDNRNDRRTSGPAKGTEKTKATGKANAAGKTKVTAGKENRVRRVQLDQQALCGTVEE